MSVLQIHETGLLFEQVQLTNVFDDGKTFPDCLPKRNLTEINTEFLLKKDNPDFSLNAFVKANFELPKTYATEFSTDTSKSAIEHVNSLWSVLTRRPEHEVSSLIPLPNAYIVPGGRFREIYYWDSYFTMLGLRASGNVDMIENMINNFSFLIDQFGYIPNGNRTYFLGRSQPPFYAMMVTLLSELKGDQILVRYLPQLEKEYQFWMKGHELLSEQRTSIARVVRLSDGAILNRYWDEHDTPRPESYKEDVELSHHSAQRPSELFRNLRAAAESGWDFSSRWFKEKNNFSSIHTTDILPVDLNCLLYHLEKTLAKATQLKGDASRSAYFEERSTRRAKAIIDYCWNSEENFFFDFDFKQQLYKPHYTLAALFPLYFSIATTDQAKQVATIVQTKFLKPGGLTTTLEFSGQQWDAPNGWAPLQWISFKGILNYGFDELAHHIKTNWISANLNVFKSTGKMTEKYDVWNENAAASGGEYPNQDGFGWTNGVFLAMNEGK